MTDKRVPRSVSMSAGEWDDLSRLAHKRGVSRSNLIMSFITAGLHAGGVPAGNANTHADINDTVVGAKSRGVIAGLLGITAWPDGGYPPMGLDAYGLALVVAERHGGRMRDGAIPMMREDAAAAGLDPDAKETWSVYMGVLPEFFRLMLGTEKSPLVDVLYEPLDTVDGQGSGSIEGIVESCGEIYPDNNTKWYMGMVLRTRRQRVRVLVPAGCGGDGVTAGLTVYAAGTFEVERRNVVMRAHKCVVRRVPGFDEVYDAAAGWGVPDVVASQAVAVLLECHGASALEYSQPFASYLAADRTTMPAGGMLQMPGGWPVKLYGSDVRATPDGVDAFRWCALRWPALAQRVRDTEALRRRNPNWVP